ncbi:MAG: D-amino-acid transaminase [Alphaproteobacteria bacterium]|nr:D-amino-acid transaminase [Alphaproteobacteria bacterium]
MSRIAYVNGRYLPFTQAHVHVEDRGYQFADGIYEVIAVQGGRLIDAAQHLDRLERSLRELAIPSPMTRSALGHVLHETIRRNRVRDGMVYLQVTRGVARRDHAFPQRQRPAVVATARPLKAQAPELAASGIKVVTIPDIRWGRCDIKSIALLPNVLAKQRAREAGAFEAWLVDGQGLVTEGSSTNAWIVDDVGHLVTRHLENAILSGITRLVLLDYAREAGYKVIQRPFSVAEAKAAPEAFLTSTTSFVLPIVRIDDTVIGAGKPGPVTLRLRALYEQHLGPPAPTRRAHAA